MSYDFGLWGEPSAGMCARTGADRRRGRRLYLIGYEMGKGNPYLIELPREEIELVEAQKEPA
jgi:hypothetical protein